MSEPVHNLDLISSTTPDNLRVQVLLAEQDLSSRAAHEQTLTKEGYAVFACAALSEAMFAMQRRGFDLVLICCELERGTGFDLLDFVVDYAPQTPSVVFTKNPTVEMARAALKKGATDFFGDTAVGAELAIIVERNLTRKALQIREAVKEKVDDQRSQEGVLDALISALSTRDTETQGHCERVTAYTLELADAIQLSPEDLYAVERGSLLHDIGKIGIPDRILLKPGTLSVNEWDEMRRHPVIGYEMCARVKQLERASKIVLHHHEAWNGKGYPHRLAKEDIPLGARLFALADTLDAMTSDRPYRAALPVEIAQSEILRCSGIQFDPELVSVFLSLSAERWSLIRKLAEGASTTLPY